MRCILRNWNLTSKMSSRPPVPSFDGSASGSGSSSGSTDAPLDSRQERERQIALMTASLSAVPQYTQYRPPPAPAPCEEDLPVSFGSSRARAAQPKQQQQQEEEEEDGDEYGEQEQTERGGLMDDDEDDESSDDEMGPRPAPSSSSSSSVAKEAPLDPIAAFTAAFKVPVSHSTDLHGFSKAVCALSLEPQGNRLAAGGHDGQAKIFDFGGMDARGIAFRSFVPESGHSVAAIG